MSELDKVKAMLEKTVASNSKAFELQTSFYQTFTRRQTEAWAQLADARIGSLKDIASSSSIEEALSKNGDFERQTKEGFETLHQANVKAFEEFTNSLIDLYTR
jgi:hypothetical protein